MTTTEYVRKHDRETIKARALAEAERIIAMRPGTANSDVNTAAIEYPVPYWVLDELMKAARK